MSDNPFSRSEIASLVVRLTLVSAITFWSVKWLMNQVDPTNKSKRKARKTAEEQLRRITTNKDHVLQIDKLDDYEMMIAAHLVDPHDIKVTWNDIAGLESLIQELRETVIFPIQRKDLFAGSSLTTAPKGVLLHGPPGCGKTLIAKATAKEAGTYFINLDLSILTDKWYGESQKLANAVFTLAAKLQPCIVFIDEIDSFLRARNSSDHEATAMMKAQFMSLWDGLMCDSGLTVIIMGATNRPQDLDKAILRRMPATFHVPMPNVTQRRQILSLILRDEPTSDDVDTEALARCTDGFSGSDLRELCRNAAVYRIRDYVRNEITTNLTRAQQQNDDISETSSHSKATTHNRRDSGEGDVFHDALRPISMDDLKYSYSKMRESKIHCGSLPMQNRIDLD